MNRQRKDGYRAAAGWYLALAALFVAVAPAPAQQLGKDSLAGLKWRLVGPHRGGRTEAAAGVPGTNTYYMGSVAGGVWKSTNAGTTWTPIFDKEPTIAIGAVAVAPSDPN
ncbi:MAG TPA: hypothetical protein VGS20_03790, partial [Candidatus Acidoferrales bacterium]|nr:hypothetical protein [Candidatus Acidoferrales bacterium]